METPEQSNENTFEKWLESFRYFVETSGYKEAVDETMLETRYFNQDIDAQTAATEFLREKGL